jgi:polysaccharide pyruvyl transferase WcaK-like protein
VDQKGYDFISRVNGQKIECKTFTESGLNYAPSSMTGKGRTIDRKQLHQEAPLLIFILCDIVDFPRIRLVFIPGADLVEKYPSGTISVKARSMIFC